MSIEPAILSHGQAGGSLLKSLHLVIGMGLPIPRVSPFINGELDLR
jgi:hypothetical protein